MIRKARQDFSIHLFFDYMTSAFRFIVRIGGLPLFNAPITFPNSTATRSPVVTVASR